MIFQKLKQRFATWAMQKAALLTAPWISSGEAFRRGLPLGWIDAERAMQVSAVSACVRLISGTVAKLPLPTYVRMGEEDRQRDRGHPLDRLLNVQANPWQTAFEFRRMLTAHVGLRGNGYALKRREGARVVALIPLHPDYVRVEQEAYDEPPTYLFRPPNTGGERRYPASEVVHLRDLTLDGIRGLSRIEQAAQGIQLSLAAETFGTAFFMNGAEPGVGITFEKSLNPKQRQDLVDSWKAAHSGPDKAHAPFVLEGGAKLETLSVSNRDSQYLQLRSFQVEDIARLYGVPPHLIGLTEKQTSWGTGVENMALGFLEFHLLDWLVMWETAAQRDLLAEEPSRFVEHVVEGLLRADFKTRMEGYQLAITNGIYSPNECRRLENRPPREGGDEYWRPSNMTGADEPEPVETETGVLPGNRPLHAWRVKARAVARALGNRSAA